jgi:hypothetical protein
MATLIFCVVGGLGLAGALIGMGPIVRRRREALERRRLASLGTVNAHRERYR